MIQFDFDKDCYGCGLCAEICPMQAITMVENKDGFKVPQIDAINALAARNAIGSVFVCRKAKRI